MSDYANTVADVVREYVDGPPESPPGSAMAGSAVEDAAADRWRLRLKERALAAARRDDGTRRGFDVLAFIVNDLNRR